MFYQVSSLPTRTRRPISRTPAVMTVFSREDILRMGARSLTDILALVPGMQTGIAPVGYPQLTFRGIRSQGSEKFKVFLDGHVMDNPLTDGASLVMSDLATDQVEKVEILHGPGSALYGSDALAGVINIVTRRDILGNGVSLTARGGSYETRRYNLEAAKEAGRLRVWGNINYLNRKGHVNIRQDALSSSPVNAAVSNAPGATSEWIENSDFSLAASSGPYHFQMQYINHRDGGFFNPGFSLTDNSVAGRQYLWTDAWWADTFLNGKLNARARVSWSNYHHDFDLELQPPGFVSPAGTVYSGGQTSIIDAYVDKYSGETQADLRAGSHTLTIGLETQEARLHDITHYANFDPRPLPAVTDVSDRYNWIRPADRFAWALFAQDQWDVSENLGFTAGGRYDRYDDVGGAFSPGLALFYNPGAGWKISVMVSRAFRAPSFRELYKLPAGPALTGSPDLDPETATVFQSSCVYKNSDGIRASVTGYWQDMDDLIEAMPDSRSNSLRFANIPHARSRGMDLLFDAPFPGSFFPYGGHLTLSVSYVDSEDHSGEDIPGVANWLGTAGFNLGLPAGMNLHLTLMYVGRAQAGVGDPGGDLRDYLLTNVTLLAHDPGGWSRGLDMEISVYNLFDTDYAYPDTSGKLPDHMQRPGITAEMLLRYSF